MTAFILPGLMVAVFAFAIWGVRQVREEPSQGDAGEANPAPAPPGRRPSRQVGRRRP